MGGQICRRSCWRRCWRRLGGRRAVAVLSSLRHGALVCAGWKAVHDALARRLVLRRQTTDEAMDMLVRCFPAVVSLEVKGDTWGVLTDEGLRAVSSLRAQTSLNLRCCSKLTDEGLRAVSYLSALTELDLSVTPTSRTRPCWLCATSVRSPPSRSART
jgi:hypothetical protein